MKTLLAAFALAAAEVSAAQADCYQYNEAVQLRGKVVQEHGFGGPGFGEDPKHDKKVTYKLLILTRPICVRANDGFDQENGVRYIQLLGNEDTASLSIKPVTVTGTLSHALTAWIQTHIVMDVFPSIPSTSGARN
jgi:hypothetical protein